MIGFYDYTVILTYCSAISACIGMCIAMNGGGHPYLGVLFLMLCGLCDTFDGRVARSKPNRTKKEEDFGVQIDSLSDLLAFGMLPVCIGLAIYKNDIRMNETGILSHVPFWVILVVNALFVLCALIRLAYFNITVEETQGKQSDGEKYYLGLPVTSTALIFPTFLLVRHVAHIDIAFMYYVILIVVAVLFVVRFKLIKPSTKQTNMLVSVGALEFIVVVIIMIIRIMMKHG